MFTVDQAIDGQARFGCGGTERQRSETWGLGRQRVSAFSSQMIDKGRDLPVTRHCLNRELAGYQSMHENMHENQAR